MIRLGKISIISLLVLTLISGVGATEEKSQYEVLLERLKNADPAVDFKQLRLEYAKTTQYLLYAIGMKDSKKDSLLPEMYKHFNNKDYPKAIECAGKILAINYVDARPHIVCAIAYRATGYLDKARYHDYVASGLITSIISPQDGKSPETAYSVITMDEVYIAVQFLGLKPEKQEILKKNGHYYGRVGVVDPRDDTRFDMYFCVDTPLQWAIIKLLFETNKTDAEKR